MLSFNSEVARFYGVGRSPPSRLYLWLERSLAPTTNLLFIVWGYRRFVHFFVCLQVDSSCKLQTLGVFCCNYRGINCTVVLDIYAVSVFLSYLFPFPIFGPATWNFASIGAHIASYRPCSLFYCSSNPSPSCCPHPSSILLSPDSIFPLHSEESQ